jgi:hypothetical protein
MRSATERELASARRNTGCADPSWQASTALAFPRDLSPGVMGADADPMAQRCQRGPGAVIELIYHRMDRAKPESTLNINAPPTKVPLTSITWA